MRVWGLGGKRKGGTYVCEGGGVAVTRDLSQGTRAKEGEYGYNHPTAGIADCLPCYND